ncbi:MAG TPA: PAS domain S-box protein [Gaiellaceae bacterium]|nr:PAS domain S-box protein [Gaiellaceae bacterium]
MAEIETQQRLASCEATLRETVAALASSEGVAIVGSDAGGRITVWGAGAETLYGWTADEVIGRSVELLVPEEARDAILAIRRRLVAGEPVQGQEVELERKDGTTVLVGIDAAPIRDANGAVVGLGAIHRNVGEHRRMEDALRAAEERYRTLVETLPAVIYRVTLEEDSRTVYASPGASALFGLPHDELQPARIRELLHPDDRERVLAEIARANTDLQSLTLEYRIARPDGSVVWVEDGSVVLEAHGDEPACAQGYLLDISARKRLEEQLLQAQKMDAVGQLAGGIAHDFNNILTAIEGYTEFALERVGGDAELREDLLEIRKAAQRAATLTGQILAFGRRQVFHSRALDLNEVIDDTKRLVLGLIGAHIEVATKLEIPLGSVLADPSQITQVLVNLAVNARDAMPAGGRLAIETANVQVAAAEAESLGVAPGAYVVLCVTDTGTGMDEATSRRVFEPFFTTKPVGSGSGLGLSMVHGIVHQSGGGIAIDTAPGCGTSVRVYLPRADVVAEPAAVGGVSTGRSGRRILLVEDEPVIRRLVTQMLTREGYDVHAAADPDEAVAHASTREFDLLVTDVVMPTMNGPQLAAHLTATRPGLRVLYVSGYPADAIAGRDLIPDHAPVLRKPFSATELVTMVGEAFTA